MAKWKIPLPKNEPPKGRVFFALAFKTDTGARIELTNASCDRDGFLKIYKALSAVDGKK